MLVANRRNLHKYARDLLGNEWTRGREKALIDVCTKHTLADYHERGMHISFAVAAWLSDINGVLDVYGVEAISLDDDYFGPELRAIYYCNTGDAYALTILYYNGKLRIGCWDEIAERLERSRLA